MKSPLIALSFPLVPPLLASVPGDAAPGDPPEGDRWRLGDAGDTFSAGL